ncbi:MAG: glycosyltransferase [Acidobacteria bacterium]|nr:glycosyltransferase [Acidobacteriota bacterium]
MRHPRLTIIGEAEPFLDGAEDDVLRALEASRDRRSDSDELARHIHDWPTRYHFSPQRSNLLRPLRLWPGVRVLDIGAGSGAIARYLGEAGADVVALEPTLVRARAAALRCADLANVHVVAGPLGAYRDDSGFDVVTCVGVLEYAAAVPARQQALLGGIGQLLRPGGTLVLAIENQLGLKYLLGYAEDHLNEPWAGIEDYAGRAGVRTFGRQSVKRILSDAGLPAQRWLYPFPDYKLPSTILDESAYARPDAEVFVDTLVRWPASGEAGGPVRLCDDRRAHRVVLREGLGPDVANSFLVLASRSSAPLSRLLPDAFLAQHLGRDRRRQWRGGKRFERHEAGVRVRREGALDHRQAGWLTRTVRAEQPFIPGPTLEQLALDASRCGPDALRDVLARWRRHLGDVEAPPQEGLGSSPFRAAGRPVLPPQYLDVVLSNFVQDASGHLHYIDDEWQADGAIDAALVYARALFWFATDLVRRGVAHTFGASATVNDLVGSLTDLAGVPPVDRDQLADAEAAFQSLVTGRDIREWRAEIDRIGQLSQLSDTVSMHLPFRSLAAVARSEAQANADLRHRLEEQGATLAGKDEALGQLAVALRDREAALAASREERDRTIAEVKAEQDVAIAHLGARLDEARADAESARRHLRRRRARMRKLEARLARLDGIISRLTSAAGQHLRDSAAAQATISQLHRGLADASTRLDEQRARLGQLKSENRALESSRARESRERADLQAALSEMRASRRSVQASRLLGAAARAQQLAERVRTVRLLWLDASARRRVARVARRPRAWREAWQRASQVLASGLFDSEWYQAHTGLRLSPLALAFHYDVAGRWQSLSPSPLFDTAYYLDQNPDVVAAGRNPLLHFVEHGALEGRRPSALFDPAFYMAQHPELAVTGENPLRHFLRVGGAAGSRPCALFDSRWYLATYPDVAAAAMNPLVHYLSFGAAEGRDPNPFFDTSYYRDANADVAASDLNPLVHYARWGGRQRRTPGPRFDPACYLSARPDVEATGVDPLEHFLSRGSEAGGSPGALSFASRHPEVHAYIDLPSGSSRVKRGQPLRITGWMRSETRPLTAAVVESIGPSPFVLELPLPPSSDASHPRYFEANVSFTAAGEAHILLGARLADGTLLEVAPLAPVTVVDDVYVEAMRGHLPTTRCFSVLYLDGVGRRFPSTRYRIDNMREALARAGIASDAIDAVTLYPDLSLLRRHDILVLFRAGWDWRLAAVVSQARAWNIPVVFDVDDYVFEPSIATAEHVAGIRDWPDAQVDAYREGVRAYRRTLEESDYFTGSSAFLVDRANELGCRSFLLNNHLNERLVALGEIVRAVPRADDRVEIVYLSGTRTHQRDFATVVPALVDVMRERPQVRLRVIGYLELDEFPPLREFSSRIVREDFVPWEELPLRTADAHIAIAPLEAGNPFCEAKSELKYFEGVTAGMAVVATATGPFRHAVRDGVTGCLCESSDDWRRHLFALVDDAALRRRFVEAGAAHALERFGPDHAAAQAPAVYRAIIEDARRRRKVPEGALAINWVMVGSAFAGSGGHNDIFIAANEMARRGHAVTLFFDQDEATGSARAIREYIESHFGCETRFEIALGHDNITHCDALIATHYTTAHVVKRLRGRSALPAYFVQDYEPFFSPVGSEYFAAEQTYRYGLLCITLGPWLTQMVERHGARARAIPFWVDRRAYHPAPAPHPPRPRVVYFARPLMPRRCYELGLEALSLLARRRPDVEICLFGAASFPGHTEFPHTALGLLTPAELGDLYRSADVGMAFSTTNPSLVTFEMMACGLPLVDLDVFDSRARHGGYPALLVEPSAEAIAEGVARLLQDRALAEGMRREGLAFVQDLPAPADALGTLSEIVESEMGGRGRARITGPVAAGDREPAE